MELNKLTRDADDLIRKVVSRYNNLYDPAGNISQIELDLMLDDMRRLYDAFKIIGQINLTLQNKISIPPAQANTTDQKEAQTTPPVAEEYKEASTPTPTATVAEEAVTTSETPPLQKSTTEHHPEPEPTSEPTYSDELESEFISEPEFELEAEEPEAIETVEATKEPEKPIETPQEPIASEPKQESAPTTLADRFSALNKSLSETLASASAQGSTGSRVFFHPIADLSSGIGLNDKFSFIAELFNNDSAYYEEAIVRINKAVNYDEANWILQKYYTPAWSQKSETLMKLKDFIKRRFI